jgi:hypothetical protein
MLGCLWIDFTAVFFLDFFWYLQGMDICRMQLMVYKCLWDNIVTSGVPFDDFFEHFRLRPQHLLSEDIRVHAAEVFPDAQVYILFKPLSPSW